MHVRTAWKQKASGTVLTMAEAWKLIRRKKNPQITHGERRHLDRPKNNSETRDDYTLQYSVK